MCQVKWVTCNNHIPGLVQIQQQYSIWIWCRPEAGSDALDDAAVKQVVVNKSLKYGRPYANRGPSNSNAGHTRAKWSPFAAFYFSLQLTGSRLSIIRLQNLVVQRLRRCLEIWFKSYCNHAKDTSIMVPIIATGVIKATQSASPYCCLAPIGAYFGP